MQSLEEVDTLANLASSLLGSWGSTGTSTKHFHDSAVAEPFQTRLSMFVPKVWEMSMLTAVKALGGTLSFHLDEFNTKSHVRYHVVLQSNPRCWVHHDGEFQLLEVGGVYTMDPTKYHAAVNWGETDRIHLVVDVER